MMILFHLFNFLALLFHATGTDNTTTAVAEKPSIHSLKEDGEQIPWSPVRKLTWDDFLSAPQRNTDAVALTSTSLGISYRVINDRLIYQITCNFSKTKSWGSLKTPYILAHEQGHFDITEVFARKLYQELKQYHFNRRTFKQDINNIYDDIVKQKETFQETYDEETSHSRNKRLQRQWWDRIDDMLSETEPYADYP